MPLEIQGMLKKRSHFYRSGLSLQEPQISADQLGVLTAWWLMRVADGRCWEACCREQVNTEKHAAAPHRPTPTVVALFSASWSAGRHQL